MQGPQGSISQGTVPDSRTQVAEALWRGPSVILRGKLERPHSADGEINPEQTAPMSAREENPTG